MAAKELSNVISQKFFGEVKANNCGRPMNSVAVHPHAARGIFDYMNNHYFDVLEAVLEQREKTLSEIAHDVYTDTGSYFAVASIFCFLKRNRLSIKKGLFDFFWTLFFTNYETYN